MEHTTVDYLRSAVQLGASDLHLSVGVAPSVRVHGDIIQLDADPLTQDSSYKYHCVHYKSQLKMHLANHWLIF